VDAGQSPPNCLRLGHSGLPFRRRLVYTCAGSPSSQRAKPSE
jgi:hypothetical protein